jgi:hypothetical protein
MKRDDQFKQFRQDQKAILLDSRGLLPAYQLGVDGTVQKINISSVTKFEMNYMGGSCSSDGEGKGLYRVLVGNLRERDHWGDPDVDGRIILGWIFKK